MRLQNAIESIGYFWLSESPDARLPGTLRISQSGAATLNLIGNFGDVPGAMNGVPRLGRLVGLLENGDPILLEHCVYVNRSFSFGGLSKQVLRVPLVLIGVSCDHEESGEPLKFSRIRFAVDGLDEWVGITGIARRVDFTKEPSLTIEFRLPSEHSVVLESGANVLDRVRVNVSRCLDYRGEDHSARLRSALCACCAGSRRLLACASSVL